MRCITGDYDNETLTLLSKPPMRCITGACRYHTQITLSKPPMRCITVNFILKLYKVQGLKIKYTILPFIFY